MTFHTQASVADETHVVPGGDDIDPLLDELISCWSSWETSEEYYLSTLAPAIVDGDRSGLTPRELAAVEALRTALVGTSWVQLPALLEDRYHRRRQELSEAEERATLGPALERERRARERAEREAARAEEARRRAAEAEAARRARQREEEAQRRAAEDRRRRVEALRGRIVAALEENYLRADEALAADVDAALLGSREYSALKTAFVQQWVNEHLDLEVDSEQAAAIGAVGGDFRIVARAGSGKTRTLVTRAVFLMEHCKVPARSLLLLAFNRRAAAEMRARLATTLSELPHVMTFHALAYALVHPTETLVYDDPGSDALGLSREVQDVIDDHLHDPSHADAMRSLMLEHFRDDWERIVEGRFHLDIDEFLEHRRSLPRETLQGEYVKSYGEKLIANTLFEHAVAYRYERNFRWNGVNYRPDFTIPRERGGVVIEYFGLRGEPDYDEQADAKRRFWATQKDWALLELSPAEVAAGSDAFVDSLLAALTELGIPWSRRSEEEIWELVRQRAIDRFTGAMRTFVGRCRKRGLDDETLENLISAHTPLTEGEGRFLEVGRSIHAAYLARLGEQGKEDFDGLMWRAIDLVRGGDTRFARDGGREQGDLRAVRYVLVDEFQDFSQMFYELACGIRQAAPAAEFFCVGDDWQAINAFAGSELRFYERFSEYFQDAKTLEITNNYRSARKIVAAGNAIMSGRGAPARPSVATEGLVWRCDLAKLAPSPVELARHHGDEITPAVLRLTRFYLNAGHDVVLLSRRNGLPYYVSHPQPRRGDELEAFLAHVRAHLPEEDRRRVTISTAHKYKGLEKDAVIVLDALERSYPLIHPTWLFLRIFGDTVQKIEDDERRLFYVATTRARTALALVTEHRRLSPFLAKMDASAILEARWDALPPPPSLDGARLEISVYNAYDVKDELKKLGYRFNPDRKRWCRTVLAESFSESDLTKQPWRRPPVTIEVHAEDGSLVASI